jgi:nucleoside-diphosphate-sugar epimerase
MKIAVTGAGGQVGSTLVRQMLRLHPAEPVAIFRNAVAAAPFQAMGCEVRVGSITEAQSCSKLLAGCQAVVNCALAAGAFRESRSKNRAMLRNFTLSDDIEYVVHLSSVAVYGDALIDSKFNTFDRPVPRQNYGRDKLAIEKYAAKLFRARGLEYAILRIGHVYGANMALSRQILYLAADTRFSLPFGGTQPSNGVHVTHLANSIIDLVLHPKPSGVYNVTDHPHRTLRELFDWHTGAAALPAVPAMDDRLSRTLRAAHMKNHRRRLPGALLRDIRGCKHSLDFGGLMNSPSMKELACRILSIMPIQFENFVRRKHEQRAARSSIASLVSDAYRLPVWLFSDGMPGSYLQLSSKSMPMDYQKAALQLADWHKMYSHYQWYSRRPFACRNSDRVFSDSPYSQPVTRT